jgi:hypothetical protein
MINIYNLSLNANIEQRAQCSMVQLSMSTLVYTIDTHLTGQKVLNQNYTYRDGKVFVEHELALHRHLRRRKTPYWQIFEFGCRPDEDAGVMVAATGKSIGSDVGYLQAWILEFQMRTYLLTEGTSKLQSRENTLWI